MKSRYKINEKKRRKERMAKYKIRYKKFLLILTIIILLLIVWGKFGEPNLLMINDYKIESETLPNSFNGIRIVQFSDLHYGITKQKKRKQEAGQHSRLWAYRRVQTG